MECAIPVFTCKYTCMTTATVLAPHSKTGTWPGSWDPDSNGTILPPN